jgi:hypothetical protein
MRHKYRPRNRAVCMLFYILQKKNASTKAVHFSSIHYYHPKFQNPALRVAPTLKVITLRSYRWQGIKERRDSLPLHGTMFVTSFIKICQLFLEVIQGTCEPDTWTWCNNDTKRFYFLLQGRKLKIKSVNYAKFLFPPFLLQCSEEM